ncbi:MAG: MaoC family dehydratase [Parvibaculales bacterium]
MTTIIENVDALQDYLGKDLEPTDWIDIKQDRINMFADATEDHQFIHVDPEAAKLTPFGTTIAHGFLTLSLAPMFWSQLYRVEGVKMGVNYGLNKVRFINPVKVDSRVRGKGKIVAIGEAAGGTQITFEMTIEIEGEDKPACVAETISLIYT